jgi:hypothetical protein
MQYVIHISTEASAADYAETSVCHLSGRSRPDHRQVYASYTAHSADMEQYQQAFHWTVRNGTVELFCLASIMHFCFPLLIRYLFSNAKQ